jgi:hypothetical protein
MIFTGEHYYLGLIQAVLVVFFVCPCSFNRDFLKPKACLDEVLFGADVVDGDLGDFVIVLCH